MTLMVRDEVDIIVPMIEYHLWAGVDVILVTDNGSIDGTRELLADYEHDDRVVVIDDPRHDKDQSARVTEMARRVYAEYGADWVINADADEFFVPVDRSLRLSDLFARLPRSLGSAVVPVVDMTGVPARSGAGLGRLTVRDQRAQESLYRRAGLHAHATHDAVHVGSAQVTVAQGNHYVSIPSQGALPVGLELESLHFPWRSYAQFATKVANAGRAYDANPRLTPSPRHHGMRDYRFLRASILEEIYLYRHPSEADEGDGLVHDDWLLGTLSALSRDAGTRRADVLTAALDVRADEPYSADECSAAARVARAALLIEEERAQAAAEADRARRELEMTRVHVASLEKSVSEMEQDLEVVRQTAADAADRADETVREIVALRSSRAYRFSRLAAAPVHWVRGLLRDDTRSSSP